MRLLKRWSLARFPWFLIFLAGAGANAFALILQIYFNELPCYHCVIARFYLYIIALAGIIGMIAPKNFILRMLAIAGLLYGSIMGVINGIIHLDKIADHIANPFKIGVSCPLYFDKLGSLPQKYFPRVFAPLGNCENAGPPYFGLNLIEWTLVLFVVLALTGILVFLSQFFAPYKKRGLNPNKSFSMKG
ncbi:disulfide bond formation protein B [Psittacicella gerlachiana]|uniref:Disulfide bond formation protein B n=1 Tax=Psittacicella gerlachiana TaxID=2028574 RepID=A0A3A1YI21_9GAMM|nr:disulfide bond formation protein B [Psittacicella gerlachiana]RIY37802.1 hypothetical protein CKF59_01520 [Psittacicella gerlachiana]